MAREAALGRLEFSSESMAAFMTTARIKALLYISGVETHRWCRVEKLGLAQVKRDVHWW
jgi:hypothetical protein